MHWEQFCLQVVAAMDAIDIATTVAHLGVAAGGATMMTVASGTRLAIAVAMTISAVDAPMSRVLLVDVIVTDKLHVSTIFMRIVSHCLLSHYCDRVKAIVICTPVV